MTASPLNYSVMKGIVSWTPVGGTLIDLGNCAKATLTVKPNFLDHYTSRQGIKAKDASVPVSLEAEVSLELDEITAQVMSMSLFGVVADQVTGDPGYAVDGALKKIAILSASQIQGSLKIVGTNTIGKRGQLVLPNVIFKAGSAFDFISDAEWSKATLSGEALFDVSSSGFGEWFQLN